ncbi:hypothetical protein Q3G72_019518 [Acer saccharum]|nr:hypothetical protein Q3G72_019518 [Acer saccharum]
MLSWHVAVVRVNDMRTAEISVEVVAWKSYGLLRRLHDRENLWNSLTHLTLIAAIAPWKSMCFNDALEEKTFAFIHVVSLEEASKVARLMNRMLIYGWPIWSKVVAFGWRNRKSSGLDLKVASKVVEVSNRGISGDVGCAGVNQFLGLKLASNPSSIKGRCDMVFVYGAGAVASVGIQCHERSIEESGGRGIAHKKSKDVNDRVDVFLTLDGIKGSKEKRMSGEIPYSKGLKAISGDKVVLSFFSNKSEECCGQIGEDKLKVCSSRLFNLDLERNKCLESSMVKDGKDSLSLSDAFIRQGDQGERVFNYIGCSSLIGGIDLRSVEILRSRGDLYKGGLGPTRNGNGLANYNDGVTSIEVFVDLRGKVSVVKDGEERSSLNSAFSRRGRKNCLAPIRH